ncbi:5-methyltetrahydropteroyltriglutamate--homocysteine S-methyltransferase [Ruminococcus albus]|uniref:5-methyltetrahydropteroyltriglutamate--homocysteine methyltransferase n=1 Tax=Ruminococcus albus (strain ATCC 27210 / DSM 20455 / JCM 14654 / NCDO 2250 / 7) TaxID=697329 RepID=E6UE59_RUMA7|nr:5-methyltetrahydropteroyltriglutamate--homocysteine S-methyltransferase [Ruminococcus albus]ADU22924.1 5-methyltetrahydropteroyltriglutamate/homocysteine S-methyltransferase [Ruminococcus albus 7 = DSM 20455]
MNTSIIGYPRIGGLRELKFASEKYFRGEIDQAELEKVAKQIRLYDLDLQKKSGLDFIPSNDFSYYDGVLDTAFLLNAVPERYTSLGLSPLDTFFAAARGYQGEKGDVKALAMKKWFNTNYHYIVPEIDDAADIKLAGTKPFDLFNEALENGVKTKPVIVGAYTFLKLARYIGKKTAADFVDAAAAAYSEILKKFADLGAEWVQFDEPSLVMDMTAEDKKLFVSLYEKILSAKGSVKVLAQTYFGDVRDVYTELTSLAFDGIGLDFVEGKKSLELVRANGFPKDKILFAGLVNGKNIWKCSYEKVLANLEILKANAGEIVINTSCSLQHVPVTLANESKLPENVKKHFAFAEEKLAEIAELKKITSADAPEKTEEYLANKALHSEVRSGANDEVRAKVAKLTDKDFTRLPAFAEREKVQKERFKLPLFPTTTIGSFPQTADVKGARKDLRTGNITNDEYETFMKKKIAECVALQEEIGLDVLVHGEFERNDMVEYFGECLDGYIFTEKAWVQSYGTRCVKPPVVWGDISRAKPMTVKWSVYAQSLTSKPMKGMLTGPVTILNWSFPREDISLKESALQIALAIREEVLDLEANGISIIQVDEAALREKLPLRRADWREDYLDWAIPAFRYVHSGVRPETQIHTHMCYSEFADIIKDIDNMDADVITFEASRSDLTILDVLKENNFRTEVGPGVYDIHSPRVPSKEEIKAAVAKMLDRIPAEKLWVNPDCGLKTRGTKETVPSLTNLVNAAKEARNENS